MSRGRPSKAKLTRACERWNKDHAPGDTVRFWRGVREGIGDIGTTSSAAVVLGGHTAGVYVAGEGFIALSHVEAVS